MRSCSRPRCSPSARSPQPPPPACGCTCRRRRASRRPSSWSASAPQRDQRSPAPPLRAVRDRRARQALHVERLDGDRRHRVGSRVHLTLKPSGRGGTWCAGKFHGRIVEYISTVCQPLKTVIICPDIVIAPQTIGRFSFSVRKAGSSSTSSGTGTRRRAVVRRAAERDRLHTDRPARRCRRREPTS